MNKKTRLTIFAMTMLLVSCIMLKGCSGNNDVINEETNNSENDFFTDIEWTRETEADTEYITFGSDGSFSYYCVCGNPVNDSDLCDGYTYDDTTKTIELICPETTESMVTTIVIKDYDENSMELDFDGEIRKFVKGK